MTLPGIIIGLPCIAVLAWVWWKADVAYVTCAQTRHVTLGREAEAAIRALAPASGVEALAALRRGSDVATDQHGTA